MNWAAVRTVQVTVIRRRRCGSRPAATPTRPGRGGHRRRCRHLSTGAWAFSRTVDVTAITDALPAGANVDGLDFTERRRSFYMSFTGNVVRPGHRRHGARRGRRLLQRTALVDVLRRLGSMACHGTFDLDEIAIVGDYTRHAVLLHRQQHSAARRRRCRRRRRHLPLERRLVATPGWSTPTAHRVLSRSACRLAPTSMVSPTSTRRTSTSPSPETWPCRPSARCRTRTSSTTTPALGRCGSTAPRSGLTNGNQDLDAIDV